MNKSIYFCLVYLLLLINTSCNTNKTNSNASKIATKRFVGKDEDKGIKAILEIYGGYCTYSKGIVNLSTEGREPEKKLFFELDLKDSPLTRQFLNMQDICLTNIAYLFYNELEANEDKYDFIRVISRIDDKQFKKEIDLQELRLVHKKYQSNEVFLQCLQKQDTTKIISYLSDELLSTIKRDDLVRSFQETNKKFGNIKSWIPFGFLTYNRKQRNEKYIHLCYILRCEVQDLTFSIDVKEDKDTNKIDYLNFKF